MRILSEAVAVLPLHLYRYDKDGRKKKAIDHTLYLLLHDEPTPEMTSFVFRETLMIHLLLWGNAYAQIIRNERGEVVAFYPLIPNKMQVDRDESGLLYYTYYMSRIPQISSKTSDNFVTDRLSKDNEKMIKRLRSLDFIALGENIVIAGAPGTGKTHITQTTGNLCCTELLKFD